jgi:hypothetical protein
LIEIILLPPRAPVRGAFLKKGVNPLPRVVYLNQQT